MEQNSAFIVPSFEGDSDLGSFDWLTALLDPTEDDVDDVDINEKQIRPKPRATGQEPKYRYRGKWGDSDAIFARQADDIAKRNLIIEVQRLRENIDTTNVLIQAQLEYGQMRFGKTFPMPVAPETQIHKIPKAFAREHEAIFQPVIIDNPQRPFYRNAREEDSVGQYQGWHNRVPETTARKELLTNSLIFQ